MSITKVGYMVMALMVMVAVLVAYQIIAKKTVQLTTAEDGVTHTGEINQHLLKRKAA